LLNSVLTLVALAAPEKDRITELPGWPKSIPLPDMYSGYIPVGKTSGSRGFIHYWFIKSQRDPVKDPIVYWTNGGPGGSGINAGLLTEMGRVHLSENSFKHNGTEIELENNIFAWSRVASVVYVSQPKGVGFSYCEDLTSECANNDVTAAEDFYDFILGFFDDKFPEYKKNDLYLTAESYGGIYIPMFMDQIDKRGGVPNLKGAAIGDGCWGGKVGTCAFNTGKSKQISAEFFQGHGMISQTLWKELENACQGWSDDAVQKPECTKALGEMNTAVGKFDIYNVYDTCGGDTMVAPQAERTFDEYQRLLSVNRVTVTDETSSSRHPQLLGGAVNDYPCGGDRAVSAWLQNPAVAKALHVRSGTRGMNYTWGPASVSGDLRPLYKRLASKYRMLIYSGDTDACVPYWGTEEWTRDLGFKTKKPWRPWHAEHLSRPGSQRAGYVIEYDAPSPGQFTFATIQGAGHLVPTYKPHFALSMIERFLANTFSEN